MDSEKRPPPPSPSPARKHSPVPAPSPPGDITENLPPPRKSDLIVPVSPPLSSTKLSNFIYLLLLLTSLLGAYYSYRIFQSKSDVGGWRNLVTGNRPPPVATVPVTEGVREGYPAREKYTDVDGERKSVEDRIVDLAEALGVPTDDFVAEIVLAVEHYVPPASLSSVAAKESGPAVAAMLRGVRYEKMKMRLTETGRGAPKATPSK